MSDSIPHLHAPRRHPSAGNLDARPTLVRAGTAAPQLPAASYPHGADLPSDIVQFGPDLDDAAIGKLLASVGSLEGRRVLDLGCGAGAGSIALARRGARVISVES